MSKLRLTVACGKYDYLQPLRDGRVEVEGIDLNLIHVECGERHHRMMQYGEYDACEFSMGAYLAARSRDMDQIQAIPFFTRRMFTHRFFFISSNSDVKKPEDLKGRRVGLLSYQNSLAIFLKGILARNYGITASDVTWVTMADERVKIELPPHIKIERAERGMSMEDLLLSGKIDLFVEPDLPKSWLDGKGKVKRLFANYEREEKDFFEKNKVFPIMHPLVIKKEILDRDPWVATSLFEAFTKSQTLYFESIQQPHRLSFVWPRLEEEKIFFGKNPFYQGFSQNRHDVMFMIDLAQEQGILRRVITPEEIFSGNTLKT